LEAAKLALDWSNSGLSSSICHLKLLPQFLSLIAEILHPDSFHHFKKLVKGIFEILSGGL